MLREKIERLLLKVEKPSRYIGGEAGSIVKDIDKTDVSFAFCFPDSYEVGMSHLGMKILYGLTNSRENYRCERVFAPWPDFEKLMRDNDIPLYSLENLQPVKEFDFVGFTLQYELCYTNVLNMLDLAGISPLADKRGESDPVIVAGGPCVCNPEPLADFIDLFIIGEGEEINLELMDLYCSMKKDGSYTKSAFLRRAAKELVGIYVPSLYEVSYNEDGTIKAFSPLDDAPSKIKKRIIKDMDKVYYPESFVVPFCEIIHDRAVVEVMRGCIRGCRFCQAGFIYRPLREKSSETVCGQTKSLCQSTGYEEVSLSSLSTSDYSHIEDMLDDLLDYTSANRINMSLPSLRVDNFSTSLLEKIKRVRKSGLTFAPEAGTQRLRDVINKNVTEDEIMSACRIAFKGGYSNVKLYFMLGLPEETDEDIIGIAQLGQRIVDMFYSLEDRPKGRGVQISISCSTFVPKPFTPFEFDPQISESEINRRQQLLLSSLTTRKISLSYHDSRVSRLEAVLARGDRRVGKVIYEAWKSGCNFDGWDEWFRFDLWTEAFDKCGVDMSFYAERKREYDEIMPWDMLDYYVNKSFLVKERERASEAKTTPNCRIKCAGCGVNAVVGGACFD